MRRTYDTLRTLVLVLVLVGLLTGCGGRPPGGGTDETNLRRARAQAGEIVISISAAGHVEPEQIASLSFPATVVGVVDAVQVGLGERVSRGQPLASVDADALSIAQKQASLSYDIQQLRNQQFEEPPSDNDLAAARAEVTAASARYSDASTVDPDLLEVERLASDQAVHSYNAADKNLRGVQWRSPDSVTGNAQANAGIAWVQAQIARLKYEQMAAGPRPEDVAAASAEVSLAAAQLSQAAAAPSELALERQDMLLEQAQVSVDRAGEQFAQATLVSPFDGVVAAVNVREGSPPPAGQPALMLVDDSKFHIEVEVDEIDISRVEVGQSAIVNLDAIPDRVITGEVTRVSPAAAADSGGVVSYIVRIDIDPTDAPLRSGMTATVDIVVEEVTGALRIPNWAIRIDRRTGDTFVNVMGPDGGLLEVQIELGLRGDAYSQVVSGLEDGQEIFVSLERGDVSLFGGGE